MKPLMKTYCINNFSTDPDRPYHVAYETPVSPVAVEDYPSYQEAVDSVPAGIPCFHYVRNSSILEK